ncbi:hypothetical protein HN873_050144 [Arachis hypogaea]|uniref:Exostosin GT47 domain-containing protein n=1 Tax=Arachis hypogaea TaxID=3818 RepID=A0A444WNR7_ARAHY|nr:hypothetical protein Ahy_Scaffold8g108548 [Arachis hypogaea]
MMDNKSPLRRYFEQFRFVFLTIFLFYMSMILLDYYSVIKENGFSLKPFKTNGANHHHVDNDNTPITPSIPSLNFTQNNSTTNGVEFNSTQEKQMIPPPPPPPLIRDNNNVNVDELIVTPNSNNKAPPIRNSDPCYGQYIYVHKLPSRFNDDLLKRCRSLLHWGDMCPYLTNLGLGPKIIENAKVLLKDTWYQTNQFSLEVIFHNIMKHYKCLTNDSALASAIFVPYYAGLNVGQYLWGYDDRIRDEAPLALVEWLSNQKEWKRMWGRDHFLIGGRTAYDFRRKSGDFGDWGTKLMFLPEARNMSMLTIETDSYDNDFPIPYPTYFHPSKDLQVSLWQKRMRRMKRPYLFSFAGAPRPNAPYSIRNELIRQCLSSRSCKLLSCYKGKNNKNTCEDPVSIMSVFQKSIFCLEPSGDSYTRRSTFDAILAGCIPVFFHPKSAYEQYRWHLPKDYLSYSVFIPEGDVRENKAIINDTLARISRTRISKMREEVIRLIPRVTYREPRSRLGKVEDAFDIAVKGIIRRVEEIKKEISSTDNVYYSNE